MKSYRPNSSSSWYESKFVYLLLGINEAFLEAVKESYIFLLGVPGTCIPLIYSLFSYNSHLAVGS